MSARVDITFDCNGCDEKVTPARQYVGRKFRGINGKDHGFGVWVWDGPDLAALYPDQWQEDPLTSADYCPKCAAEIWGEDVPAHNTSGGKDA